MSKSVDWGAARAPGDTRRFAAARLAHAGTRPLRKRGRGALAAAAAACMVAPLVGQTPAFSQSKPSSTLVYAISATPADLDTSSSAQFNESEVFTNTLSRLFDFKTKTLSDGNYVMLSAGYEPVTGSLATSWTVAPNKKVITINLRRGVKNYLGHLFTAADVQYTIDRLLALNGTATAYLNSIGITKPSNLVVMSPYKIQFRLNFPAEMFFKMMSIPHLGIYDEAAYKAHATHSDPWATNWAHTNSVGWGPYYITQNEPGVQVVLKEDPNYWGHKGHIQTIIEKDVPSTATQLSLLEGGAVNVVGDLDPRQLLALKGTSSAKVASFQPAQVHSDLYMNLNVKPFNNQLVRQAVCYALPYKQIVSSIGLGTASQQQSPLPANYQYYNPSLDPYNYNVAKAKQLLAKAGFPNGFSTSISYSSADDPSFDQLAVILKSALGAVGINASLVEQPFATWSQDWLSLHYNMGIIDEGAFIPDYTYALRLWYYGPKTSNFLDFTNFYSKKVNSLMSQAEEEFRPAVQKRLATEEQQLILQGAPACYLIDPGVHIAYTSNLTGVGYLTYSAEWYNYWQFK